MHNDSLRMSFGAFCPGGVRNVSSESSDVTFDVLYELSQPMGRTEFSSIYENRINSAS